MTPNQAHICMASLIMWPCRLVILDAEDSWAKELVEAGIIDNFSPTDLSDQDTVFDICMAGIRRTERVRGAIMLACLSFLHLALQSAHCIITLRHHLAPIHPQMLAWGMKIIFPKP